MGRPPLVVQVWRVGCVSSFVGGMKLAIVCHANSENTLAFPVSLLKIHQVLCHGE